MTSTTSTTAQTDADRAASVVAGRTIAPKPKRASRATRAAEKNDAPKPKPTRRPTGAASIEAADKKKSAKPEMTESEARTITQSALVAAAGAMIEHWDERKTGVSKADARRHATERLSYCGKNVTWDARLDPRTR